jgi:sulfite exporter TauE/SafE
MCGGFPVHLAGGRGRGGALARQGLFLLGKGFTYVFLGALAGALGVVLMRNTGLVAVGKYLPMGAGLLTILFGLLMLGIKTPGIKPMPNIVEIGFFQRLLGSLLTNPSPTAAFALGLGVGFVPCPLPIAMLIASAGSHSVLAGMLTMAGVGLGTAPGLFAVGMLGTGINRRFAKSGMRVAGIAVLIVGVMTLGRATGILAKKHPPTVGAPARSTLPPCCGGEGR